MSTDATNDSPSWGTERAGKYAKRVIESAGTDKDAERALRPILSRYGIGYWQLWHLAKGKAKTCSVGLYGRLQLAYLDVCARQVVRLQEEIKTERALGDDDLGYFEAEAQALAKKIAAKMAARRKGLK